MTIAGDRPRVQVPRLFISYAREDQQGVQGLLEGIERLGHEVWVDKKLSGGQAWWDEIVARIRACDAMLIVVSPDLLDSQASTLERTYAQKLGKPLLPVVIRPVSSSLLPADLAPLQFVDYTSPGPVTAFELAGALTSLPAPAPLPDPLPDAPAVPIPYLSNLTDRVHAASLTLDEQLALAAQLHTALDRPGEREDVLELLQALERRRDLYYAAANYIDQMRRQASDQQIRRQSEAQRSRRSTPRRESSERPPPIDNCGTSSPNPQHTLRVPPTVSRSQWITVTLASLSILAGLALGTGVVFANTGFDEGGFHVPVDTVDLLLVGAVTVAIVSGSWLLLGRRQMRPRKLSGLLTIIGGATIALPGWGLHMIGVTDARGIGMAPVQAPPRVLPPPQPTSHQP